MEIKLVEVSCPTCGSKEREQVTSGRDFEYATSEQEYTFHKCRDCGIIYLSPRPDVTELNKIYPPEYNPFNFHRIKNPIVRLARTYVQKKKVKLIKKMLSEEADIMDVGCGSGTLLLLMQQYGSRRWQLYGNDFNEKNLERLKAAKIKTFPRRFEEIETDLLFDAIILNQTIEHLERPAAVVKKAAGLLRTGGVLIVETPSTQGLDALMFKKRYWGGYHVPRHWNIFSADSISALLQSQNLTDIKISFLVSPSFWIQSFHHYFLEKNWPKWWVNLWVVRNPLLLTLFTLVDLITVLFCYPTSNMRIVASKMKTL